MDALHEQGIGFPVFSARVPIVPAAILFDLLNGGDKGWLDNPYKALGRHALAAAADGFALGSAGAGAGATTAGLKGGLGSASVVLPSGHTVGALVAVNALGSTTVGDSGHFWAAPFEMANEFGGLGPAPRYDPGHIATKRDATRNTTIAIVATDARLSQAQAQRLAIAAHDGMARAIVPSHTPMDGDLVFAAATGALPLADPQADTLILGHAAATCLARAIARGVFHASASPGDFQPTWQDRFG
jgi:D-aminopeptidase